MKNPHSPCSSLSSLSPLSFSSFFSDSQCHPSCYISLHWKTLHSRGRLSSSPSSSYRSSPPPSYLHLSCSFSSLFPTSRSPSRTVFSHSFVRSFSSRTSMPSSSSPPPLDSSSPSHSSSSSSVSCSPLPLSSFQLYLSPYRLRGPVNRKISKLREERELALLLRRHQEASTDPSTTALPSPHEVLPSSSSHRSKPFSRYSKTSISSDTTSDCFAPSEEGPVGREEEDTSDVKRKKSSSLHFHEGRRGGDIIGQHRAFIRRGGAYRDPLRGVEKNEGSNRAYEKFLSQGVAHAESRVVEVLRQARHLTRKEEEEKKKKDLGKERRRHPVLKMIEGQEEQTRDKLKDKRTSPAIEVDASRRVEKSKGREGELRGTNVTNRGSSLCEDHLVDHHTHLVSDSSSSSPTSPSDDVSSSHSISSSSSSEASSSSSFSSFSSNIADVYFSHVHHVHMIAPPPKAFRDLHVKHLLLPSFSPNELYPSPSVLSLSPLAQVEEKVLEKQQAIARRHHSGIEERKTEVYLPISQEEERCKGQEEEEATPSRLLSVGRANQNDDLPSSSSVSSPDQVEQEGESGYVGSCVHTPEKDVAMVTMSSLVTSAPSFDPLALRRKEYTDVYEDEEEEGEMEIFRQPWRSELVEEHAKVLAADIKAPGLLELQSQVKEEIEGEMKLSSYTRKNGKKEKIEEEKSNDASSVRNMNGANRQRSAFEPCHEKERDTEGRKSFTSSGGEDDYRNSRSSSSSSPSQESSLASSSSSFSSLVELTQHHSSSSSSQSFLARENPSSSSCSSPSRLLETQSSLSAAPSLVLAAANARMRDRLVCQTYRRNRTNEDFLLTASHEDSSSELPCRAKPISCSSSSPGKDVLTSAGCGQPNASVRHEPCHLDYGRDETASCLPLCTSSPYRGESTPFEREEQEDDQGGVDTVKERREVKERKRTAVHLFSGEEDKSIYLSRGMSTSDISRPVCKSSSLVTSPTSPGCGENLSCTPNDSSVYTPPEKREMDLMSDIFEEALRGEASSSPSSEGTRHPTQEKESSPLGLPRDDGTEELYASLSSPLSSPARTLGRRRYRGAPREQAQVAPHAEDHRGEKTNEVGDGDWSIRSFSDEAMPSGQPFRGEMKFEARDHPFEGDVDELEREIFLGGEVGEREQQDERGRRREFDIVWKAQCAGLEGAEKLSSSEFSKTKKDLRDGRSSSRSNRGERKQEDEETSLSFPSSLQSSKRSNTLEEEDVVLGGKEEEERSPTISLSAHLNQEKERNVKKADSPQINNDEGHFSSGVQSSSLSQVNERGAVAEENDELAPDHHERFSSYSDSERRRRPDTKTKEMTNREEEEEEKRQSGVGDVSFGLDDPFEMSRKVKKHESLIEFWRTEGGATVYENYNGCILPVQTQRGALAAYEATRKECALFDVSFRRVWYVKGQDRHQVLDMILTCDLERAMKTGDVQYGALLDSRGLILDECFVAKLSRHVEIWTSGAAPAHCFEYVAQFINYCRQCGLEVQLSPAPLAACVLSLQGPLALPLLGERLARYKNAEEGVQESTKEENEKEEKSLRGQSPTWELRSAWGAPMSIQQMLDMYYMTCFQLHLTVGNPQGISRTSDTSRPSSCRDSSSRTSKYMMTCLRAGSTGEDGVEIAFPSVKAALPFLRLLLDTRPLPQESCSTGRFLSSSPSSSSSASPSSSPCQLTDFTQDISLSEGSISFSSSSSSSRYVSVTLEDTPGPSVSGSSLASSSSVCTSPMRSPASVDLSTYRPTIGCLYALDMLRMEAGLPRMGVDIKTHHTLAHASLCCLLSLYKVRRQLLLCYQPIQRHVAFGSKIQRVGIVAGKEDRLRAINLWAHYEGMKRRKSQSLWLRRLNDETGRRGARQISNLDKGLHHDSRYPLQKLSSFLTRHTQSPSRKKSTGLHPPEEKEDERQSGEDEEEEEDLYWAGEQREALKGWRSRPRIPGVNEKEGETTSLYALGGDDRPPPSSIFSAGRKQKPSDHVSRSYFPFHGCIILSNPHRRPIGVITSCSWSPHFKCRLAQGLVLREFAKHNQAILISVPLPVPAHWSSRRRGRALRSRRFRCLLTAQVHRLPFVQHRYPQPESELASSIERSFAKKTGPSSHSSSPAAEHKTNERKKLQKSVR